MKVELYSLAIISGILLVLGSAPIGFAFIMWFSLVPLLLALHFSRDVMESFMVGLLTSIVFYGGTLFWFFNIFGILALIPFGIIVVTLPFFTAVYKGLFGAVYNKKHIFWLPVLWVAVEYLRSEIGTLGFPLMTLGSSQWSSPEILQAVSLVGVYGLSFILAGINTMFAIALIRLSLKFFIFPLIIIIGMFVWGKSLLPEQEAGSFPVAIFQTESSDMAAISGMVYSELPEGLPGLILFPECTLPVFEGNEVEIISECSRLARAAKSNIVIGILDFQDGIDDLFENYALVFSTAGNKVGKYSKNRLVPFLEWLNVPGRRYPVFDLLFEQGKLTAGIEICYDLFFENVTRKLVRSGAEVIFAISREPLFWPIWQKRISGSMTILRAVESRRYIVRASSSGYSQIVDPFGRVVDDLEIVSGKILRSAVNPMKVITVYHRIGWIIPIISIFLLFISIIIRFVPDLISGRIWRDKL